MKILDDMRRASALCDEMIGPGDYSTRMIALAMIARQYLRELDKEPPISTDTARVEQKRKTAMAGLKTKFVGLFSLAGITVNGVWELPCGYDRNWEDNPWFLFLTPLGLIEIGWRKRVISIDWSTTAIRAIVTADDVTKGETFVHAWSEENALTYLKALLSVHADQLAPSKETRSVDLSLLPHWRNVRECFTELGLPDTLGAIQRRLHVSAATAMRLNALHSAVRSVECTTIDQLSPSQERTKTE